VEAIESLVHALVGTMGEQVGHRDGPIFEAVPFASMGAGWLAVIGILASLHRRGHDGVGRGVETSLYDGALAYLGMMWGDSDANPSRHDHMTMDGFFPNRAIRQITGFFRCADDEFIGVHTGAVGGFGRLMDALGFGDRIPPVPPAQEVGTPLTDDERTMIAEEIHSIFAGRPRDAWVERLLAVDVCAIPCRRAGEVFDEPQPQANGAIVQVADEIHGPLDQVGPPIRLGDERCPTLPAAPRPGSGAPWEERSDQARPWLGQAEPREVPLLDGVTVLDLGVYFAGPAASRHLADLGADVIKLETVAGDPLRGLPRLFRGAQAGKRSLAVDLKDPELHQARDALIAWADVVHHNMRPGAADRLGLGSADIRRIDPSTICGHSPGWGSAGPYATQQSFEPMMSGYVGLGFEVAGQFNSPVYPAGNADAGNGLIGAAAMLLCLLHRARTGEALSFECPQVSAAMGLLAHIVRRADGEVLGAERLDPLQLGLGPLDRLYETSDGWICLAAPRTRHLDGIGRALDLTLLGDPRFADAGARAANAHLLEDLLARAIGAHTTDDLERRCRAEGVPVATPVPRNGHAFLNDPENARTGRVALVADPEEGTIRAMGRLVRVTGAPTPPYRIAPELGEHSEEILLDAGYSREWVQKLIARGAVRTQRRMHVPG